MAYLLEQTIEQRTINDTPKISEGNNILYLVGRDQIPDWRAELLKAIHVNDFKDTSPGQGSATEFARHLREGSRLEELMDELAHHKETYEHSLKTGTDMLDLGYFLNENGYSSIDPYKAALTGLVHDVGKAAIWLIVKKGGTLSETERKMMETHPETGSRMLDGFPAEVIAGVYGHHQGLDGSGYPKLKKGESVNPYAQLVRVVETYDALTRKRCYHEPVAHDAAMQSLQKDADNGAIDAGLLKYFKEYKGVAAKCYEPASILQNAA